MAGMVAVTGLLLDHGGDAVGQNATRGLPAAIQAGRRWVI
jgi:hypothetical protein